MSENIVLQNEEENVIIATFNITSANTTITLKNLEGMTQIDWGDGTVGSELTHTYANTGEFTCKIYSVTSIGEGAFSSCSSLTSVVIPDSVTSIGPSAFYWCDSLTSVVIGDSVTSIGSDAFSFCSSLTSVKIPNSVTSISEYAFARCDSLTSVVIPDSVTSIGDSAFLGCSSLTEIVIPDSVTSIGPWAFFRCGSLMNVVIGDRANSIGKNAFSYCHGLTHATFKSEIPLSAIMISQSGLNNTAPIYYVPDVEIYRNAWSGTIAAEQIQLDPIEQRLIDLAGLRTYHETLEEKYLNSMATQEYADKKIINLNATDVLTNQDAAAFITLTKDILDGKCNVFVKLNNAVGALVTEVYYSETECQWRVFGQAGKAFYTLTAVIDGENKSITLKEEPLGSILAQFMTAYLNSEETAANKPTAADISTVFNEDEEA